MKMVKNLWNNGYRNVSIFSAFLQALPELGSPEYKFNYELNPNQVSWLEY